MCVPFPLFPPLFCKRSVHASGKDSYSSLEGNYKEEQQEEFILTAEKGRNKRSETIKKSIKAKELKSQKKCSPSVWESLLLTASLYAEYMDQTFLNHQIISALEIIFLYI